MRIQQINPNKLSTRLLKNKTVLRSLEKISEHGTSFHAGTSLFLSLAIRPLAIISTPNTEKENKQYAAANSICSGLIKFGIVEAIAIPIENAVKNIDENPHRFLKNFDNLSPKSYKLLTQIVKLSTGFFTAIPKSMLTLALIPVLMDKMFFKHKTAKLEDKNPSQINHLQYINDKSLNFTGGTDKLSKALGKIIDNKTFQNFAKKYESKDKDIAKHITAGTDILLTSSFVYQTNKSDKIKENRKKALIYNNVISTAITLTLGYGLDKIIKNKTAGFIDKFKQINAADPKLQKYVEGINILRPALIFAGIYYCILPIFSTYMAEKIDKYIEKHSK